MNFANVSLRQTVRALCFVLAGIVASSAGAPPAVAQVCIGDCDGGGSVTVDEIITMVNIALGTASIDVCPVADSNDDDQVTVDEIVTATNNALNGCPPPSGCQTTTTVTVALTFEATAVPVIAGLEMNLNYPIDLVSIPGSGDEATVVERYTDITDTSGSPAIADLDSDSDAMDDQYRTVYLASGIPLVPGGFETVRFDCEGSSVPTPQDFVCEIPLASDAGGLPIEGVTCTVTQVAVP